MQGSEVTEWGCGWRLPDAWVRRRHAVSTVDQVFSGLGFLAAAIGVIGVVILGVQQLRRPDIRWRSAGWIALAFAVVTLLDTLLHLSTFLMDYPTADPLTEYVISAGEALFRTPLLVGIAAWPLISLSSALYPEFWLIFRPAARRAWRRDAVVAAVVSVAGYAGVSHLIAGLFALLHWWAPLIPPAAPVGIDTYLPGVDAFCLALLAMGFAAAVPIIGAAVRWLRDRRIGWTILGVLLLIALLNPADAHSGAEFLIGWIAVLLPSLVILLAAGLFLRTNVAAYLAACLCMAAVDPAVQYLSQPSSFYRWNGVVLVVLALAILAWLLGFGPGWRTPAATEPPEPVEAAAAGEVPETEPPETTGETDRTLEPELP